MTEPAPETSPTSWIDAIWFGTWDPRAQDMLRRRFEGQTFDAVGTAHGVTRERARQLLGQAEKRLLEAADLMVPTWRDSVRSRVSETGVASDEELSVVLIDQKGVIRYALLRAIGLRHPRTWAGDIKRLWANDPRALQGPMKELVESAPYRPLELREKASALGISEIVPIEEIAADHRSPLTRGHDGSWLRRRARGRDAAYLWLSAEGRPRRADAIDRATRGSGVKATNEALRRDERFRLIRPEGTWALAEWTMPGIGVHTNTLDVMLEVLGESGPLSKNDLFAKVTRLYPVSTARLQQCLISDRLGLTDVGLIDLVEHGARPIEELEPRRPPHIVLGEGGALLGIRLPVDKDLLRGSGIVVHNWLTWHLGLRLAPMSRTFSMDDGGGDVTIRRGTGGAQISSLRRHARRLGMSEGCELVLLLRSDTGHASLLHVCRPGSCSTSS
ncbi:RNA polymerase subunit sigma-70 [Embleya sp. NBC_00896]|uniref:RNA polymerase subunit sigma-70 n=1 Tax=Embleya sp. NBC_00896 TaxID=2975961 RepID=UPI003869B0FE|nr:RNA polymerase subunit sigma-70 [Embleya sp. NBC_00896]